MGTRNLTCVMLDGKYRVAQYGQWDGYPEGQGKTVLNFLCGIDFEKFKSELRKIRFLTEDEHNKIIELHTDNGSIVLGSEHDEYWKEHLTHIDRDIGAKVLYDIYEGKVKELKNSIEFAKDSLFCEFCYVIDLDKNTLEIYRGFSKEPLKKSERFYSDAPPEGEYYPIRFWHQYPLDVLPTEKQFFSDLTEQDEDVA